MDLAAVQIEVDAVERCHPRKAFGHSLEPQHQRSG